MIGNDISIDFSMPNFWRIWQLFRKGKRLTSDILIFSSQLEQNLFLLQKDLMEETYFHEGYKTFFIHDNKKRKIQVASVRDKIVHRLLYEYLVKVYDKTFMYDAWSCRKGKGLHGAILRAQKFINTHQNGFIWRGDVKKFFDSVSHEKLKSILFSKISNKNAQKILHAVIDSTHPLKGIPIGNLTSQIFANIYLNEFDRFIKHTLKISAYVRYGDDFIIFSKSIEDCKKVRTKSIEFLREFLSLEINPKNDIIIKSRWGLKFLGVCFFPYGRKLTERNQKRTFRRIMLNNIGSYYGFFRFHQPKKLREIHWHIALILENHEQF